MPDLMEALAAAARHHHDDEPHRPRLAPDIEAIRLRDSYAAFSQRYQFKPGMIVRQKLLALNYTGFGDNDIAIVVEVLDEPVFTEGAAGSQHFHEPNDMIVGSIENGRTFCLFHVDSRRFEPVPEENIDG